MWGSYGLRKTTAFRTLDCFMRSLSKPRAELPHRKLLSGVGSSGVLVLSLRPFWRMPSMLLCVATNSHLSHLDAKRQP